MASNNEKQASYVGNTPKLLRNRLNEARAVLLEKNRHKFQKPTFDFANKRLVSDCGTLALQWKLRQHPDQPESLTNQQTSRGMVVLVHITE